MNLLVSWAEKKLNYTNSTVTRLKIFKYLGPTHAHAFVLFWELTNVKILKVILLKLAKQISNYLLATNWKLI
jgi:hypothetical protein